MLSRIRSLIARRGEQWPLRDHFVITSVYAAMVFIGFGIAGRQL